MTNKTEALARIDALEREASALRSIIEAPEPVVKKPLVWDEVTHTTRLTFCTHVQDEVTARAYADAITTLIDLRRQPGSEVAVEDKWQWCITSTGDIANWTTQNKVQLICPMFNTHESAEAALKAVGKDRILCMMNTLHGRGYD